MGVEILEKKEKMRDIWRSKLDLQHSNLVLALTVSLFVSIGIVIYEV